MPQRFERCCPGRGNVAQTDSLASLCWPTIRQDPPVNVLEYGAMSPYAPRPGVSWPVAEPWRRNMTEPRCGGQGRCQGDPRKCNSKYRYGVDDVGQCPSATSCRESYSCNPCPAPCANPCP